MDKGDNYEVKDIGLAEQGRMNLEIAESHMDSLLEIKKRFEKEKPFEGIRIGLALHITKETGILVRTLYRFLSYKYFSKTYFFKNSKIHLRKRSQYRTII